MVRLRSRSKETTADPAPEAYPQGAGAADHALHLSDETCARCNRPIKPTDEARRTATGGCVHLCC